MERIKDVFRFSSLSSFVFIIFLTILFSCNKEEQEAPAKGIHVVGEANSRATYWENGAITTLSYGQVPTSVQPYSSATSIALSGSDVIISGFEWTPSERNLDAETAKYWLNGEGKFLTERRHFSRASSVKVSLEGDVYIAGNEIYPPNETSQAKFVGKYWQNELGHDLISNSLSDAYSIALDGEDVYVVGVDYEPTTGDFFAKYWKNEIGFRLSDESAWDARAMSVFVYDGNVYIAGSENEKGVYWLNGVKIDLMTPNAAKNFEAQSIFVTEQSVFVAGRSYFFDGFGAESEAILWKDGEPIHITTDTYFSEAKDVFVDGEDIYVAGSDLGFPCYWKNGVKVVLSEEYGIANSIIVVR